MESIDKEYNQGVGESYEDWKYRLLIGKRDDKVKLSWEQIRELLNIKQSVEYIRKIAAGIAEYRDYLRDRNMETLENAPQSALDAIDEKEYKLRRQKMLMQDQRRELNKKLREWARAEHIQEEVTKAIKKYAGSQPLTKPLAHVRYEPGENEGVLLLSDWHVGMSTANFHNLFNDTVLEERVDRLMCYVASHGRMHKISRLNVFILGDMINGLIHVTTRIANTEDVIRQCMKASELLCSMLGTLSEHFPEICVYFARGNHDRVTANMKDSLTKESFFDMIPWYLQARLEGIENIKLVDNALEGEIIHTTVCDNQIFAVHGHHDKVPKVVENLSLMLRTIPDYVFLGHYHAAAEREVQGADVIVNSSLCGTDDYAINIRKVSKPAQKFMIFNKAGRLCTYDINLEPR